MAYRFRRRQRIRSGADYRRIYARRCWVSDDNLSLCVDRAKTPQTRLGLSVSKKKVGNAVKRNRWKRKLREAFRLSQEDLPSDVELVAVPRGPKPPDLQTLCSLLKRLAHRGARKLARTKR
ncbi:MAG: ribonuclease P protein component [Planctomycetales bacterium]